MPPLVARLCYTGKKQITRCRQPVGFLSRAPGIGVGGADAGAEGGFDGGGIGGFGNPEEAAGSAELFFGRFGSGPDPPQGEGGEEEGDGHQPNHFMMRALPDPSRAD